MVGVLEGAVETKVRPAVVIASADDLTERPGVLHRNSDAESHFGSYVLTVHRSELIIVGHRSDRNGKNVKAYLANALALW